MYPPGKILATPVVVNLVKLPQAICKISGSQTISIRSCTQEWTHRWMYGTPENRMPYAATCRCKHKNIGIQN